MTDLEHIPANEAAAIADLGERLKAQVIRQSEGDITRRDAHPKMHGLVKAEFTVHADLPEALAIGLFSQAKTYPAWVRFSNAADSIKPDIAKDIRGMAVKLIGVPGEKLLQKDALTHDFLLVSIPAFMTPDVAGFAQLVKTIGAKSLLGKLIYFLVNFRVTWNLLNALKRFANPLQIRYFSATPYLLGERAVKYSAIPHVDAPDSIPQNPSDDFLREAMDKQLTAGDVVFDFCVQLQTDSARMPIEDSSKVWSEKHSPFHPVATLRIPQQAFATPERDQLGENLSFNPWHALPAHRPLGGINRARRVIYTLISDYRHQMNQTPNNEPVQFEGPQ